mgnify:CR=1 FL=1
MIEVRNLTKKYGDHEAVSDISFTVEEGHIYGFLGPNGAGKSTTMNIITGYMAATSGDVIINGHDILKEPRAAKSCIGYLPEVPPVYQDLTVREYLEFAAEIKGMKKQAKKDAVAEAVKTAMLEEVEQRLIKNLSKGYKQRVGLAQAIIGLPEVLILDEPTSGLDPKQIMEMRDLIKRLGDDHTVILSSHILSEVSAICDHVIMISGGKIVANDSLEALTAEKSLEEVFLELTDSDRLEAMDVIDLAAEKMSEEQPETEDEHDNDADGAADKADEENAEDPEDEDLADDKKDSNNDEPADENDNGEVKNDGGDI